MKVFYRPEQSAPNAGAYSPSAGKPALVVQDWLDRGLVVPDDVMGFEPASTADLKRAHDATFVDEVLQCRRANGFNNRDPQVAASLPYTSGSLLAAARHALTHRENVCSPTSGFHHAHFDQAYGYCTFNGLMVTAMALLEAGEVGSVGIIDCDMHYGDGTDDIIAHHGLDTVIHRTMGQEFHDRASVGPQAQAFKRWLEQAIDDCRVADLVIYQAGADPHVEDPLGGVLSSQEMAERDHMVFKAFQGRALVWNLAGGYQRDARGGIEPVLKLHRTTAEIQTLYLPA